MSAYIDCNLLKQILHQQINRYKNYFCFQFFEIIEI